LEFRRVLFRSKLIIIPDISIIREQIIMTSEPQSQGRQVDISKKMCGILFFEIKRNCFEVETASWVEDESGGSVHIFKTEFNIAAFVFASGLEQAYVCGEVAAVQSGKI